MLTEKLLVEDLQKLKGERAEGAGFPEFLIRQKPDLAPCSQQKLQAAWIQSPGSLNPSTDLKLKISYRDEPSIPGHKVLQEASCALKLRETFSLVFLRNTMWVTSTFYLTRQIILLDLVLLL